MSTDNKILGDEPCPGCRSAGRDRTGNHLITFESGDKHCNKCYLVIQKSGFIVNKGKYKYTGDDDTGYTADISQVGVNSSPAPAPKVKQMEEHKPDVVTPESLKSSDTQDLPTGIEDRGIRGNIMRKYGVRFEFNSSDRSVKRHYYPITFGGEVYTYKYRDVDTKKFMLLKGLNDKTPDLFGMLACDKLKGMNLLITEGELDAMSAYQMLEGKVVDLVVLSLPTGANVSAIHQNLKYIQDQQSVTICYDQDDAGYLAEEETWKILPDVKVMRISEKDANDMLKNNKHGEFLKAYNYADTFKPKEHASIDTMDISSIIEPVQWGLTYPWDAMTKMTYGMHLNQVIGIGAAPGAGKGLAHGQVVLTNSGEKYIEDVKLNDTLRGTSGTTKVIGVYPQGIKDIYRVSFTDGTHLDVDDTHLWTMRHTKGHVVTLNTLELKERHREGKDNKRIFSLPEYEAVDFTEKELEVDPYVLGVWLGDGSTGDSRVNCPQGKIEDSHFDYYNYKGNYYMKRGLKVKLRSLGVLDSKHIPESYLKGSIRQRERLLKGLLDTDGHDAGIRGWEFDNTNEGLVDSVVYLARSLGFVANRRKTKDSSYRRGSQIVRCKPCYRCVIRKKDGRVAKRYVDSVEYIGKSQSTCIMVDAKDSLFLAKGFIPTHNTTLVRGIQQHLMYHHKEKIGIFSLEEKPEWTTRLIAGYIMNKPIHIPDTVYNKADAEKIIMDLKGRAYFYEHKYYEGNWEDIENHIRYLHVARGVRFFFIDPISALVSHLTPSEGNKYLSEAMYRLSKLVQQLDITVFHVNHLNPTSDGKSHEAGAKVYSSQFTGSRAQWRYSHSLFGAERNQLAEDGTENSCIVRFLKDRAFGNTGKTCTLEYSKDTGRLNDVKVVF